MSSLLVEEELDPPVQLGSSVQLVSLTGQHAVLIHASSVKSLVVPEGVRTGHRFVLSAAMDRYCPPVCAANRIEVLAAPPPGRSPHSSFVSPVVVTACECGPESVYAALLAVPVAYTASSGCTLGLAEGLALRVAAEEHRGAAALLEVVVEHAVQRALAPVRLLQRASL